MSFLIGTLGRVGRCAVVRGLGGGGDAEALRMARTIPHTWVPGRLGRRPVPVLHYQTLVFRLPQQPGGRARRL